MEIVRWHDWRVTTTEAIEIQNKLVGQISRQGDVQPHYIAGVDVSVNRFDKMGIGAVVVLGYPGLNVVETRVVTGSIPFPYVPSLLSFREIPLLLPAFEKLTVKPDLCIVDGQGIAHPRRIGLAAHLGLCLDIPTIGCAKSRLCGSHEQPGNKAGNIVELKDKQEIIGMVVRTRTNVKPVYVSIGHKIDLNAAVRWVLNCCLGYRLPEPTRKAHQAAGGNLELGKASVPVASVR
jgi:deoxyribonuclease V